jgi:hypothetical protein
VSTSRSHSFLTASVELPGYRDVDFIRYSRIANVEWNHGFEASGCLRRAQAGRSGDASCSIFSTRT